MPTGWMIVIGLWYTAVGLAVFGAYTDLPDTSRSIFGNVIRGALWPLSIFGFLDR